MTISNSRPGIIEPGVLYRLDEAAARLGLGKHAMREARRDGLPVLYRGGRGFLLGSDIIDFLRANSKERNHAAT